MHTNEVPGVEHIDTELLGAETERFMREHIMGQLMDAGFSAQVAGDYVSDLQLVRDVNGNLRGLNEPKDGEVINTGMPIEFDLEADGAIMQKIHVALSVYNEACKAMDNFNEAFGDACARGDVSETIGQAGARIDAYRSVALTNLNQVLGDFYTHSEYGRQAADIRNAEIDRMMAERESTE